MPMDQDSGHIDHVRSCARRNSSSLRQANDPAAYYLLDLIALSAFASMWTAVFVFSGFTRTWLGSSYLNRVRGTQPVPAALFGVAMAGLSAVPDQDLRAVLLAGMPAL
jgi:hypothetical protein